MTTKREAGVLMSVSSLPGPFGIGVLGKEAKEWIDRLADMGFSVWQVLPFTMGDMFNSPYASCSAFAGNPLYIDPRGLQKMGYVSEEDLEACVYHGSPYSVDYAFVHTTRMWLLRKAFANAGEVGRRMASEFEAAHSWAGDFALYMAVSSANRNKPWVEWKKEEADYSLCVKNQEVFAEDKAFWLFTQSVFTQQWQEIHRYAASKNIDILGDMPIYVAMESADAWSKRELFCLNQRDFRPDKVAGVPPDYFSEDGQLWGNPIYDWEAMRKDGYHWWIDRIREALSLYDRVRIDHFRAFASYWAVPAGAQTARVGKWEKGPGMELFQAVKNALSPNGYLPIVAEDLGEFGEDVVQLLHDSGFPGMRVVQFGFDSNGESIHLPHNFPKKSVAYIGTHDNNTLLGWLYAASDQDRRYALDYCGFHGDNWGEGGFYSPSCRAIIETVWRSASDLAVIPFQDMCGFGADTRMNTPGIPEGNWCFRTTEDVMRQIDSGYYRWINHLFSRS